MQIEQISVLLPTYLREEMVIKCMGSIAKQSQHPKELIVLDQGHLNSKKLSKLWDSYSISTKLIYLRVDHPGKSNALNIGVEKANSNIIAAIDDDCYADSTWVQTLMKAINENKMTIITGQVIAGTTEQGAVQARDHDDKESPVNYKKGKFITPIFILSGGNFCFRKDDFRKIGPFNTCFGPGSKYKSAEDVEWCYRALSKSCCVKYIPEAIVEHRSWRNEAQDLEVMEKYGYGAGAFFRTVFQQSKFDFLYHGSNIARWLIWEQIKCMFQSTNSRPYVAYAKNFIAGFRS
jgi:GT2 family glycosyltransferase